MNSEYTKRVIADEIKYYDEYDLKITYEYYKERQDRLGEKEKPYLEALEAEVKARANRCPKCNKPIYGYPALSRKDNKTEICSECGNKEALNEWLEYKMRENDYE